MYKHKLTCLGLLLLSNSAVAAPTEENTTDNGDGTFTYTQKISVASTTPHYTVPSAGGFDIYSWFNQDYGWQHSFSDALNEQAQIQSATLLIRGYDIDSEAKHGTGGEYDGISVDGTALNPRLLQGKNKKWSETTFDVPISSIQDDGLINTFVDIDMNHTSKTWATTLDYSLLTITYMNSDNNPPEQPTLSMTPSSCTLITNDLVVNITGPSPADSDGDSVTYEYRWFVDIGQGSVVDDEVAGKTNHQTNTVPADQTVSGETWRVQVTAVDSNGLVSDPQFVTWDNIGVDCDEDGVNDNIDDYPTDPERAFNNYSTQSTLVFEDLWPSKGDYDLNDFVLKHTFNVITNAQGQVKQINLSANAVARGASIASAFAISFPGTDAANVDSASITIEGNTSALTPESGHDGELVMVLIDNIYTMLPAGAYSFYNSQAGDNRPHKTITFSMTFTTPITTAALGGAPFNPFIYAVAQRGKEIHLVDKAPSDLADNSLFGTEDDNSDSSEQRYYQTASGHPWALNITTAWSHPLEYIDVLLAYPNLKTWAESGGINNPSWYNYPNNSHCWRC